MELVFDSFRDLTKHCLKALNDKGDISKEFAEVLYSDVMSRDDYDAEYFMDEVCGYLGYNLEYNTSNKYVVTEK